MPQRSYARDEPLPVESPVLKRSPAAVLLLTVESLLSNGKHALLFC